MAQPPRLEKAGNVHLDHFMCKADRMESAIRDLIIVSRTVQDSVRETREVKREMNEAHLKVHDRIDAEIDKLREARAETGEKLNILVSTVDRIIRHRNDKQE